MKWVPPLLCAVLLCCALTPVSAATKSEQVERYLGKYRFEHDRPVGIVKFIFQKAVLKRQGNGKLTYRQLLVGEPYYSNEDNAGKLIGIQVVNQGKTMTILPEAPDKPAPELWINEVGVAPSHQGQGLGRKLMDALLTEARRLGCSEAWVLTNRSNVAAMKLYASCGGVEAPEDAVMFEFNLED